jgi:hypothetical protein
MHTQSDLDTDFCIDFTVRTDQSVHSERLTSLESIKVIDAISWLRGK